jgi:hypothetical protein
VLRTLVFVGTVLFLGGFLSSSRTRTPWTFYGFLALSVMGSLGVAEVLFGRIELGDDHIAVRGLFQRRRYPRAEVTSVSWAKGCPVSLGLSDGTWVKLPDTGHARHQSGGSHTSVVERGKLMMDGRCVG